MDFPGFAEEHYKAIFNKSGDKETTEGDISVWFDIDTNDPGFEIPPSLSNQGNRSKCDGRGGRKL